MQRPRVLASVLAVFFALSMQVVGQDAPAPGTYKGDAVCRPRRGVYPHRIFTPDPGYDDKDRKKRVQGTVFLSLIVTKEGDTAEIKVEKSLTPGLDKEAVKAVSRWRFEPVTDDDGKPCPMNIKVEVEFRLY
ncbi:MAG TPA: energy transducer TonB [Terriglobales bacterium]|nr:energy transducer TonB [Terriglobales bacterium]